MTIQDLVTAAWPYIVVLAAIGLLIWFAVSLSRWYGAEPESPPAMDLGPLVDVPPAKKPEPRTLTSADKAKAIVAAKAKADSDGAKLLAAVEAERAAMEAEKAELESILTSKPEAST